MRVIRKRWADLGSGDLARKVRFEKRQTYVNSITPGILLKCAGIVFTIDTEGEKPADKLKELHAGSKKTSPEFPTAIGVAHPCIEAWLLADPVAVAKGLNLAELPHATPSDPESLPAPHKEKKDDPKNHKNPKTTLGRYGGSDGPLGSKQTTAIARHVSLSHVEIVCPLGFKPFADEVRSHLLPLFHP